MLIYIYYIMIVMNMICVLLKSKPKMFLVINYAFAFLLFLGTTDNADYKNYAYMYANPIYRTPYEIGFNFFMDICNAIGLPFEYFLGIVWLVFGTIILYVFSKLSDNYPFFFLMYFSYMIFIDITQIKSFCATAILTLALYYYSKQKKIASLCLIVTALLFHIQCLFFLPLIFINPEKIITNKFIKNIIVMVSAVGMLVFLLINNIDLIGTFSNQLMVSIGLDIKQEYFIKSVHWGFLVYMPQHIASILATYYCKKKIIYSDIKNREAINTLLNKCLLIQIYCVLIFPFLTINLNFFRLYKMTNFITYAAWAAVLDSFKKTTRNYYKCLCMMLLSVLLYRIPLVQGNDQRKIILISNKYIMK